MFPIYFFPFLKGKFDPNNEVFEYLKEKDSVTIFSNAYKCGKIIRIVRLRKDSLHSERSCMSGMHVHIKGNIEMGKNQKYGRNMMDARF